MPVEITCEECGEVFSVRPSLADERKYCSQECSSKAQQKRVSVECDNCGEVFNRKPSALKDRNHLFCSTECHNEWESGSMEGSGNPMYQGKKVTVTCDFCGSRIKRWPSVMEGHKYHFCGVECRSSWFSENMSGQNAPDWKGGFPDYYGHNWTQKRKQALERDSHTCQDCGVAEEELNEALRVHHIDPIRNYPDPEDANTPNNLVSLCRSCHRSREADT